MFAVSLCFGQGRRQIAWEDLPAALRSGFAREGFGARMAGIDRATAERERLGEYDHLIFYMLQSERFTREPRIEPARSAYEFYQGLREGERAPYLAEARNFGGYAERVPAGVRARMRDLLRALARPSARDSAEDERLAWFRFFLAREAGAASMERLSAEYARAMQFLYRKEFGARAMTPAEAAAYVSSLYQERAHSTDTQIEANFAVHEALAALRAQQPGTRIARVLIVGPGMDFAPRTDLMDLFGPQSYQPFAVADSLLGLGLAKPDDLRIDCVDINERVIAHLGGLAARGAVTLSLLSGIADAPARPLTDDFRAYFQNLGRGLGAESPIEVPARYRSHLHKAVRVRPEAARMIRATRLNIITERIEPPARFDLVIVTNVFPYFSASELTLALTNIAAMLAGGGFLIHNELQAVPPAVIDALGLPLQQARTVLLAADERQPLFDGIAIHRKRQ